MITDLFLRKVNLNKLYACFILSPTYLSEKFEFNNGYFIVYLCAFVYSKFFSLTRHKFRLVQRSSDNKTTLDTDKKWS